MPVAKKALTASMHGQVCSPPEKEKGFMLFFQFVIPFKPSLIAVLFSENNSFPQTREKCREADIDQDGNVKS